MEFQVVDDNRRTWVLVGERPIGALSATDIRPYVFPFCTPAGRNLLQDWPPDHPHQQGICVGQHLVNGHNFWAMGMPGFPLNTQKLRSTLHEIGPRGVRFKQAITWVTVGGQAVLEEERSISFEVWEEMHGIELRTRLIAAYGDLSFGQTKEGGIALRVHYHLEAFWGGIVRNSAGDEGEKNAFDKQAEWIEASGRVEGSEVGVVMMPHPSQPPIPWFTRDYGLHLYSPFRHAPCQLRVGESLEWRVGFAAYDGRTEEQAARAWEIYRSCP